MRTFLAMSSETSCTHPSSILSTSNEMQKSPATKVTAGLQLAVSRVADPPGVAVEILVPDAIKAEPAVRDDHS
jgi:hypothetical protein